MKMRYSIEPRDRIYLKRYGFLSFSKNMGKCLSNKHGQKILDSAKKSTTDATTGDLIGIKVADEITSVSKKNPAMELHSKKVPNNNNEIDVEITTHKKRYISPEERQKTIDELRLVPKKYA